MAVWRKSETIERKVNEKRMAPGLSILKVKYFSSTPKKKLKFNMWIKYTFLIFFTFFKVINKTFTFFFLTDKENILWLGEKKQYQNTNLYHCTINANERKPSQWKLKLYCRSHNERNVHAD